MQINTGERQLSVSVGGVYSIKDKTLSCQHVLKGHCPPGHPSILRTDCFDSILFKQHLLFYEGEEEWEKVQVVT